MSSELDEGGISTKGMMDEGERRVVVGGRRGTRKDLEGENEGRG